MSAPPEAHEGLVNNLLDEGTTLKERTQERIREYRLRIQDLERRLSRLLEVCLAAEDVDDAASNVEHLITLNTDFNDALVAREREVEGLREGLLAIEFAFRTGDGGAGTAEEIAAILTALTPRDEEKSVESSKSHPTACDCSVLHCPKCDGDYTWTGQIRRIRNGEKP